MVTMRTFAEEKSRGTIELLLTSPVNDIHIIIGKWLGAMWLYLCVLSMSMINIALLFAWGKPDLKNLKTNLEKGASAPDSKMKLEFTKDEAELLQFKSTVGETTTWGFSMAMKVDGKDITCQNNIMVGAGNEAELKREMDACKTLKKK